MKLGKIAAIVLCTMLATIFSQHGGNRNHITQSGTGFGDKVDFKRVDFGILKSAHKPVEDMDKYEISSWLHTNGRITASLAAIIEGINKKIYIDTDGGVTIGIGYNIRQQRNARGDAAVIGDLRYAGIENQDIFTLIQGNIESKKKIRITALQSLLLFDRVEPIYRKAVSKWLGDKFFTLTRSQQASLTYLAYNVGERNLRKFVNLRKAIVLDNMEKVREHIVPKFQHKGRLHQNIKAGRVLFAAYCGGCRL